MSDSISTVPKKKILICGATGFIGRNMVEHFAKNPAYEVHAVSFTRPQYQLADNNNKIIWHQADLRKAEDVERVMSGIDIMIQAAATTSGAKDIVSRPYIHVTDNAVMNSLLLRAAFEHKLQQVIFFSCTVMYQSSETAIRECDFDENTPLHPRYFGVGNTKIYIEKMCEFFSRISSTRFTAIRHSNIYGPHDKFDLERSHVFGATISKVMTAENKITIWGSGEEERDVLHVRDLNDFVEAAIKRQTQPYRLYNCGFGRAISIKNLAEKIVLLSGKKLAIEHDLTQPTIKTSLFLDCSLAEQELGWKPKISLDEGITETIKWWRDNINPEDLSLIRS